jgi:hypothetical protein
LKTIRRELPEGMALVHNNVRPRRRLGCGGFRAWTQKLDDDLEVCICDFAGALPGIVHYRIGRDLKKLGGMPGA